MVVNSLTFYLVPTEIDQYAHYRHVGWRILLIMNDIICIFSKRSLVRQLSNFILGKSFNTGARESIAIHLMQSK